MTTQSAEQQESKEVLAAQFLEFMDKLGQCREIEAQMRELVCAESSRFIAKDMVASLLDSGASVMTGEQTSRFSNNHPTNVTPDELNGNDLAQYFMRLILDGNQEAGKLAKSYTDTRTEFDGLKDVKNKEMAAPIRDHFKGLFKEYFRDSNGLYQNLNVFVTIEPKKSVELKDGVIVKLKVNFEDADIGSASQESAFSDLIRILTDSKGITLNSNNDLTIDVETLRELDMC